GAALRRPADAGCAGPSAGGAARDRVRVAGQRRQRQIRRPADRGLRRPPGLPAGLRGARRHEPGRASAALRGRRHGARVRAGARRRAPWAATAAPAPARTAAVTAKRVRRDMAAEIPKRVDNAVVTIGDRTVRLTNLQKPFWPERGITKGDLLRYYIGMASVLLPHLADRAMVMKRYPHGAGGSFFFMKRTPSPHPHWLKTCAIAHGA